MANVGEQLKNPEEGYRRISLANYIYLSTITNLGVYSKDYGYNGKVLYDITKANPSSITFSFYSKKFRFISKVDYESNEKDSVKIEFDNGVILHADQYQDGSTVKSLVLQAEYTFEDYIHTVTISSENNGYMWVDCVDIDEDGYLIYKDENTGRLYCDKTPLMTSNSAPAPYVVNASSYDDSGNAIYMAFDNSNTTSWCTYEWSDIGWISVGNKNNSIKINTIGIIAPSNYTSVNSLEQAFRNFKIEGSNDNTNWTLIKEFQTDVYEKDVMKLFSFNKNNYNYYRLYEEANGRKYICAAEIKLFLSLDTTFYLIKDNVDNKIYNYDEENNQLVEVQDTSILNTDVLNNTCICNLNKVLPLLDGLSDDLTLLCNNDKKVIVKGLKKDVLPLVIARTSFSTRLAENIDFFELISDISETSSIKMALSVDTGTTWKVWDNDSNSFIDLTNRPPLKKYEELSEEELLQWNTFRDEVNEKGIDSKTLKSIDINSIKSDNMMFAYTFNRNSYEDKCEMSKLQYQFDAYGSYILLNSDSSVSIKQSTDSIVVTPKKDMSLMKVNIGSSGEVTINNINEGQSIINTTEEEMNNLTTF